jgi:RHS repeat-associated protein
VVTYFLGDHLGSIIQTTGSTGSVTLTREYDPWGTLLQGNSAGGYSYTGREWDPETNLFYYRARYYDAKAGRFVSEDPLGFDAGENFYAYVGSDPIGQTDPRGLRSWPIHGFWCGPDWTGGQPEEYSPQPPGHYRDPVTTLDAHCKVHDICYYDCRQTYACDAPGRSTCFRRCDYTLTAAAYSVGGVMGRTVGAAINRPGTRDPGPNSPTCLPCKSTK